MSGRLGARKIITLNASHASLASKPLEVSALIAEAGEPREFYSRVSCEGAFATFCARLGSFQFNRTKWQL